MRMGGARGAPRPGHAGVPGAAPGGGAGCGRGGAAYAAPAGRRAAGIAPTAKGRAMAETVHEEPRAEAAENGPPVDIDALNEAAARGDAEAVQAILLPLHPADIADALEQMRAEDRERVLPLMGPELSGEMLTEVEEGLREEIIESLGSEVVAEAARELETDDVVDLIEDLDPETREAVLGALDAEDRIAVEAALTYPEDSAGRLMQREVTAVPEHWDVGRTIDWLRAHEDLPGQFYHMILVDPGMRPTGYVTLGRMLGSRREVPLTDLREESFRTIPVAQDVEEVAYAFNQYHLISAPVVDAGGRLIGVITIDDAMAVLSDERDEDLLLLAGVGDESLNDRTMTIARQRFPWLAVNLLTAILASLVIAQFEGVIAAITALAVLMPIVASMGGNAGTQSMTVAVRAIATKDLTRANALRVLRREVVAGLLNGLAFAIIIGVVGLIWFGSAMLGVVIGVAMVVNLVVAGFAGLLIPLALEKVGVDPALASGAFVTTVTDVVGFFAFLGLAAWVLI